MAKLTICGGGNAAHVLIALACHGGWDVDVFAPYGDEAQRLRAGQIEGGGLWARFASGQSMRGATHCISADAEEVVPGSEMVLLALPAFAHNQTLLEIGPYLDGDSTVGVLPARSGFDYVARTLFRSSRGAHTFFGLQTLPWACRISRYGQEVEILGTKATVDFAVWPADERSHLAQRLQALFDVDLRQVSTFLTLTLANTGQLIHPGIMYGLCAGCESVTYGAGEAPLFYQAVDDKTAALLQAMSDDVQALALKLEEQAPSFRADEIVPLHQWLLRAYPHDVEDGRTLRSAFNSNRAYAGLKLPLRRLADGTAAIDFSARYLSEDVPFGLVVLRGIAQLAGVSMPAVDEVIYWAQERMNRRFLKDGVLDGPDLIHTRAPQAYGLERLTDLLDWNVAVRS